MFKHGNSFVKFHSKRTKKVINQDTFQMLWRDHPVGGLQQSRKVLAIADAIYLTAFLAFWLVLPSGHKDVSSRTEVSKKWLLGRDAAK